MSAQQNNVSTFKKHPFLVSAFVITATILATVLASFFMPATGFKTQLLGPEVPNVSLKVKASQSGPELEQITVSSGSVVYLAWNATSMADKGGMNTKVSAFLQEKSTDALELQNAREYDVYSSEVLTKSVGVYKALQNHEKALFYANEEELKSVKTALSDLRALQTTSMLTLVNVIDHATLKNEYNKTGIELVSKWAETTQYINSFEAVKRIGEKPIPEDTIAELLEDLDAIASSIEDKNKEWRPKQVWNTIQDITTIQDETTWVMKRSSNFRLIALIVDGRSLSDTATVLVDTDNEYGMTFRINGMEDAVNVNSDEELKFSWTPDWTPQRISPESYLFIEKQNPSTNSWVEIYKPTTWTGQWSDKATTSATYRMRLEWEGNTSLDTIHVTVNDQGNELSISLLANGEDDEVTVKEGESATLSWSTSEDPRTLFFENETVNSPGQKIVTPKETTAYSIYNRNPYLDIATPVYSDTVNVRVEPATSKVITLTANGEDKKITINAGMGVKLEWFAKNDPSEVFFRDEYVKSPGAVTLYPTETTEYTVYNHDPDDGTERVLYADNVVVEVVSQQKPVTLKANGEDDTVSVRKGDPVHFEWTSLYDPTQLFFEGETVTSPGSKNITATESNTYTIYSHDPSLPIERVLYADSVDIVVVDVPVCGDDQFEPNNTFETAAPLSDGEYNNLVLCRYDVDTYKFWLEKGSPVEINAAFRHIQGDVDLYLYKTAPYSFGPIPQYIEVAKSVSTDDNERIEYKHDASEYLYLVAKLSEATPINSKSTPYTLSLKGAGTPEGTVDPVKSMLEADPLNVPIVDPNVETKKINASTIKIQLKDKAGQPVANTGVELFGISDNPIYCIKAPCPQGFTIDPMKVETNEKGYAESMISATRAQGVTLHAKVGEVELANTPTVNFYDPEEYKVVFTGSPSTIYANTKDSATLNLTVKNDMGDPASGNVQLSFTELKSTVTGKLDPPVNQQLIFAPQEGTLDVHGQFASTVKASQVGLFRIKASLNGNELEGEVILRAINGSPIAQLNIEKRDNDEHTDADDFNYPIHFTVLGEETGVDESFDIWASKSGAFPDPMDPDTVSLFAILETLEPGTYTFTFATYAHLPETVTYEVTTQGDTIVIATPLTLKAGNVAQGTGEEEEKITTADVLWFYMTWNKRVSSYEPYDDSVTSDEAFLADFNGNMRVGAEDFSILISNLRP